MIIKKSYKFEIIWVCDILFKWYTLRLKLRCIKENKITGFFDLIPYFIKTMAS